MQFEIFKFERNTTQNNKKQQKPTQYKIRWDKMVIDLFLQLHMLLHMLKKDY